MKRLAELTVTLACVAALAGSAVFCLQRHRVGFARRMADEPAAVNRPPVRLDIPYSPDSSYLDLFQSGALSSLAEPSLEMRENTDFLLTPALLIQDVISDGVVIAYPEE